MSKLSYTKKVVHFYNKKFFLKYRKWNKLASRNPTDPAEYFTGNGSNLIEQSHLHHKMRDGLNLISPVNSVKSRSTLSEGGCQQTV